MKKSLGLVVTLSILIAGGISHADTSTDEGDKLLSGMSIVGNDEAPKSLVIVPWKSSVIGDTLEVSRALDNGMGPVDRDVFQRGLNYYEIQSQAVDSDR